VNTSDGKQEYETRTVTLYDLTREKLTSIGSPIENCTNAYLTYIDISPTYNPANSTVPATLVLEFRKLEDGRTKLYRRDLKTGEDTTVELEGK